MCSRVATVWDFGRTTLSPTSLAVTLSSSRRYTSGRFSSTTQFSPHYSSLFSHAAQILCCEHLQKDLTDLQYASHGWGPVALRFSFLNKCPSLTSLRLPFAGLYVPAEYASNYSGGALWSRLTVRKDLIIVCYVYTCICVSAPVSSTSLIAVDVFRSANKQPL